VYLPFGYVENKRELGRELKSIGKLRCDEKHFEASLLTTSTSIASAYKFFEDKLIILASFKASLSVEINMR
jgi:hypothetical protein